MPPKQKYEYAISACLVGVRCRWDGKSKLNKKALALFKQGKSILVCPEVTAGLPTPRPACEIIGGDGADVLRGQARVISRQKKDFTRHFIKGAKLTYQGLRRSGVRKVMLKSGSPSCGVTKIYSGKFDGLKKSGCGVFTAMLAKKRILKVEI